LDSHNAGLRYLLGRVSFLSPYTKQRLFTSLGWFAEAFPWKKSLALAQATEAKVR